MNSHIPEAYGGPGLGSVASTIISIVMCMHIFQTNLMLYCD